MNHRDDRRNYQSQYPSHLQYSPPDEESQSSHHNFAHGGRQERSHNFHEQEQYDSQHHQPFREQYSPPYLEQYSEQQEQQNGQCFEAEHYRPSRDSDQGLWDNMNGYPAQRRGGEYLTRASAPHKSRPHDAYDRTRSAHETTKARLEDGRMTRRATNDRVTRQDRQRRDRASSYSDSEDQSDRSQNRRREGQSRRRSTTAGPKAGPIQMIKNAVQQKGGLDKMVTPMRLGLALGAFDIISGSLIIWMTRKQYGGDAEAAQDPGAPAAGIGQHLHDARKPPSQQSSKRRRPRNAKSRAPSYEYDSVYSTDSEEEERHRRAEAFAREQARLDRDRQRAVPANARQA